MEKLEILSNKYNFYYTDMISKVHRSYYCCNIYQVIWIFCFCFLAWRTYRILFLLLKKSFPFLEIFCNSVLQNMKTAVQNFQLYDETRLLIQTKFVNWNFLYFKDTVSVHRPGFYAHRFLDFMADKVFKKIPSRKYFIILRKS